MRDRLNGGATDKAVRDFLSNLRGVRAESTPVLRLETDWISADPVVFAAPDSINAKLLEVVNTSPLDGAKNEIPHGEWNTRARYWLSFSNTECSLF